MKKERGVQGRCRPCAVVRASSVTPGVCGASPGPRGAGDEPYGGVMCPYVASQHAAAWAPRAAGAGAHRRRPVRLHAPPSCLEGASVRVGPVSAPLAAPLADWGGEPRSAAARCDWTSSAVAERVCGSDVRVRQLLVPVPRVGRRHRVDTLLLEWSVYGRRAIAGRGATLPAESGRKSAPTCRPPRRGGRWRESMAGVLRRVGARVGWAAPLEQKSPETSRVRGVVGASCGPAAGRQQSPSCPERSSAAASGATSNVRTVDVSGDFCSRDAAHPTRAPMGRSGRLKSFVQRLIGTRGQTAWGIAPPEPST